MDKTLSSKANNERTNIKKAGGGTYRKANIALGISALGLAFVYPFQSTFAGGLLTSGFSASLVGGVADWFAVNALFRRPLGVPAGRIFRTEIIPRNRERIFLALSDMVEKELLSPEVLKSKLLAFDFASTAQGLWQVVDRDSLESIITQMLQHCQETLGLKTEDLVREIILLGQREKMQKGQLRPLLERSLLISFESEEGKKLLALFLHSISNWVQDTEVHFWLTNWLEKAIQRYANQNPTRKLLALVLPDPAKLAHTIQERLAHYLREEETLLNLVEWLKLQTEPLSESILAFLTQEREELAGNRDKLPAKIAARMQQKLREKELAFAVSNHLIQGLEGRINSLKESEEKQHQFNDSLQQTILPLLERKHHKIGEIVLEGLEKYSDEMLVELIEDKAGEDLQMIRINGSVVGGLAGMLIYLVTKLLLI